MLLVDRIWPVDNRVRKYVYTWCPTGTTKSLNSVRNQQSHSPSVTRLYTPPPAAAPPTPIKAALLYLWCPSASHGPAGSGGGAAGRQTPASSGPAPAGPLAASPAIA